LRRNNDSLPRRAKEASLGKDQRPIKAAAQFPGGTTMNRLTRTALYSSLSLAALAAAPAFAQSPQDPPTDEVETPDARAPGDEIIVTGTRRTDRTVADSPVPIDVISAETLSQSGFTETNRLLNQQVPSFNFPQPAITDGTDVVRPATLRGLSPDQTLVLVNGKRRHTTALLNINGSVGRGAAAVDINLIPSIALSRVEVLRDGAAAQYGSDAIAGVLNFQLSDRRSGGRIQVNYGTYISNVSGIEEVTGLAVGANGQPTTALDGTFNLATTGKDRHVEDGETVTAAAIFGLPIGAEGHVTLSAQYQDRRATNRTGYDPRRQFNLVGGAVDAREFTFNRLSHRYGDPDVQDILLFLNAGMPLSDAAEVYAFGSYGNRDGQSAAFYRLASDARNVPAIYPNGFLPLINTRLIDKAGTVGVRGEIGGFRYDLSGGHAENDFDFLISNTLNRSFGAASPRRFDSGGLRYGQSIVNLDLSRDLAIGFAESATLSGGLEYRRETFRIRPGEPGSYQGGTAGGASGAQGFPGFAPVIGGQQVSQERDRNNKSAYAELDVDFSDRFNVQVAGRYEDYSDFGSDWNGKIATRFEPVEGFAVRGSASTGFRAPSLQQQFFAAQATNNVNGLLLETVTLPVDNPIAIALGATPLEPETSVSFSAGLVFTAVPRLNVTIDVYQVSIDDRIVVTENLSATRNAAGAPSGTNPGLAIATILNNAGFNTTNAARFFINGLDTRTRGLDAVATYRMDIGSAGRLSLTAGYNYNKTKLERILAAPGPLANVPGVVLFGRQERLRLTDGQPRDKITLSADYEQGFFGATVRGNRYGNVLAAGGELGQAGSGIFNDVNMRAKWITDAEIRLSAGELVDFAFGANNIFDVYPDEIGTGLAGVNPNGTNAFFPASSYVTPFSAFSPFGFNGRFVYGRMSIKF
jgi:iron complex outermembrane recepter protein